MRRILIVLTLMAIQASCAQEDKVHKVVFQMSTQDREEQLGLIRNLNNLLAGWGNNLHAEVVAHGPGISMLRADSPLADQIRELTVKGVVFIACENTMKQKGIAKSQLIDSVRTVPMGLAHIIERQEQGWSYIKANF